MNEKVDYRFSLANERTYLAWIRTALALIAGGIAIRLFIADVGGSWIIVAAAVGLSLLGGLISWLAYRHWLAVQDAMERGADLPPQHVPLILTGGIVVLAVIVIVGTLL